MPMNPNFLCCIGAELKNSTQQTTRMTQVYLYRAFEDDTLSDMLSAGFFNEAVGVLRKDDLLLLYSPNETVAKWTYARVSNVDRDGVTVAQIGIDATAISVDTTGYSNLSGNNLQEILNNLDTTLTTINNAFVKKDGSSVMTGPLKFHAGSFVGAIAGGLGDGISIYKLKSDDSIDSEVASLTKENGFTPGTTNAQDIGSSSLKWKDLYVARVIASVLNNGANINIPTTAGTMALTSDIKNSTITIKAGDTTADSFTLNQSSNKNITIPANVASWSSNVTNCITEIPQDIKLDLANGTLTLKAGSKIHMADGNLETTTTISDDITRTSSYDGQYMIILYGNAIFNGFVDSCLSGTIANRPNSTAHNAGIYFATDENKIYVTNDAGATWVHAANMSMPFAIITVSSGAISSIDQIFNGFGYIGSTVFALPGVKGLIPTGKNTDGTLKNATLTTSSVLKLDVPVSSSTDILRLTDTILQRGVIYYIKDVNYNCITPNYTRENIRAVVNIGSVSYVSGKITSFSVKNVFNALNYNDSGYIANCAMPSDKYVDLTLGATGTLYTAPGNGYFTVTKQAGASGEYIYIANNANGMNSGIMATGALNCRCFLPVSKGDSVQINYTLTGTTSMFRFVFANGAK